MMKMPKSKYEQTKVPDEPLVKEMTSVQDIFSIISIDESGIFELPERKFSKLYVLSDNGVFMIYKVIFRR